MCFWGGFGGGWCVGCVVEVVCVLVGGLRCVVSCGVRVGWCVVCVFRVVCVFVGVGCGFFVGCVLVGV